MPDISMCPGRGVGGDCADRNECYRFTATPTPGRQSFIDYTTRLEPGATRCDAFTPIYKRGGPRDAPMDHEGNR